MPSKLLINVFRKTFLLLIIQLLTYNAKGQQLFQKTYNSDTSFINYAKDEISAIQPIPGGYLVIGSTQGFQDINAAGLFMRIDNYGAITQSKAYKNGYITRFKAITPANDGNYITVGTSSLCNTNNCPTVLGITKLTPQGIPLWSKSISGGGRDYGYSIRPAINNNFIVSGWYYNNDNGSNYDVFVAKFNSNGDTLWTRAIGTEQPETTYDAAETQTGNVIVASNENDDILIVKLKPNGDIAWSKTYGPGAARKVIPVDDGYIIGGYKKDGGVFEITSPFILKLDTNGVVQYYKSYYGPDYDYLSDLQPTPVGGFIIAGMTASFAYDVTDLYLIKCKADLSIDWARAYGGYEYDEGFTVYPNPDGTYLAAGYTASFNNSNGTRYSAWLLQTDSVGATGNCHDHSVNPVLINNTVTATDIVLNKSGRVLFQNSDLAVQDYTLQTQTICPENVGVTEIEFSNAIKVYPNPANDYATIESPLPYSTLSIINMLGQTVYTETSTQPNQNRQINICYLPNGVYTISLLSAKGKAYTRLVISR